MQTLYRHRQHSRATVASFIAMTVLFSLPLLLAGPHRLLLTALAPIYGAVAVLHWLLYSMTIEVSGEELRWWFGPGVWRKRIALSDIARVARVRLPWWYGIGIKYTPQAWVYLIAPGEGIEIHSVGGDTVRIGTDDTERLIGVLARQRL
jgi:hypothetical protein